MKTNFEKFRNVEVTNVQMKQVIGGDQGIRMNLITTCNPDGQGTIFIEKTY